MKFTLPKEYSKETKKYMSSIVGILEKKDALKEEDWLAVRMLAASVDMFFRADEELRRAPSLTVSGGRGTVLTPLLKARNDAQIQAVKLIQEFGLTPKSKERIKVVQDDDAEENPLAAIFG